MINHEDFYLGGVWGVVICEAASMVDVPWWFIVICFLVGLFVVFFSKEIK